jgi:hypothetical protein
MFCPNCGASVPADAPFCTNCGASQPVGNPQAPPPGNQPPGYGQQGYPPPGADPQNFNPQGFPPPGGTQQGFGQPGYNPQGFAPPLPPGAIPYVPRTGVTVATGRWISEGWQLVQADLGTHVLIALIFLALSGIVPIVLQGPLLAGVHISFARKLLYGRVEVGDVFKGFNYFVPALIASLVISVFVTAGFLLCIIPGIVLAAFYQFTYLFIVDKRMDFWPAMQASFDVVKQNWFGFTLFIFTLGLLQLLGVLACIIGLLITLPIMYAAITVAYRDNVGFEPNTIP